MEERHETLHPVVKFMVAESHCIKIEQPVEPELAEDSIFNFNLDLFGLCELLSVALILSSDPE